MENKLIFTDAPHIRKPISTSRIMLDVIIALIPATAFAVYNFGLYALALIAVCIFFCVATEFFFEYFTNKPILIKDLSSAVTGLIVGLNLTANVPMWAAIASAVVAILLFKCLFGGIGKNLINPAIGARVALFVFTYLSGKGGMLNYAVDAYSGATPLTAIKRGAEFDAARSIVGLVGGTLGEVSAIAILIGAAYLLIRKVITWEIPVSFVTTTTVYIALQRLITSQSLSANYIANHIFGGGLLFGAVFMATDYVTSPMSREGKLVYGALLGILTGFLRTFSLSFVEGVSFAILAGNLLRPVIDKIFMPKPFGIK